MKKIFLIFLILFVIAYFIRDDVSGLLTGKTVYENKEEIPNDFGNIEVFFCQVENCKDELIEYIKKSDRIDCAFYDFDLVDVMNLLKEKEYRLVVDDSNVDKVVLSNIRKDGGGLMHNKFCVFDNFIAVGSMNPTENDINKNDNNLVFIESKTLIENYRDEFNEMWNGDFKDGEKVRYSKVNFNGKLIENYFCPEDCISKSSSTDFSKDGGLNKLISLVEKAKKSIKIAAFSLTSDRLRDALIKARYYGVDVKIVMEKRNANGLGSEYETLRNVGIDIKLDEEEGIMHHKFIVIDDEIVEFGSYNYGKNANDVNDENMLIIHDNDVASKFSEEFDRIWNL